MEFNKAERRKRIKIKSNKQGMTREKLRTHLEKLFSDENPFISRHDPRLNQFVAWGTCANADSAGIGIKEHVIIGNKTFYSRSATIDWLVDRVKE